MERPSVVPTHAVSTDQGMKILPFVGICFGYFMVLLDTTIVNVAGPAISHDLGGGVSGFQWVVSAYTLVFASLLLTAGALSDQFGAKRVFLSGLVIFGLGSAFSVVAPTLFFLIGFRALIGVGGALLLPPSLTLLTHAFPDPRARARAMGIWTSVSGVALVAGPVIGGFSLAFPALTVAVMAAAPQDLAGIASGALNASRKVGAALGVAVLGAILNGSPIFLEGMHRVLLVAGIALVSGGFFVLIFVRRT